MGICNLKVTLGTVNYTDFLHITAAKVSDPAVVLWEDWIDVPVSSANFIIPGLDPEIYYVSYFDAATYGAQGSIQMQLVVNALTSDVIMERRFYLVGGPRSIDPINGASSILDPYLVGKTMTGLFKENFRYLEPGDEWTNDPTIGQVDILVGPGIALFTGEKVAIEIKYNVGVSVVPRPNGLYNNTIDVPEITRTLVPAEINSRVRLVGNGVLQSVTVCLLALISQDDGFYFDNSVGGTAVQVKILLPGTDRIRYNGFMVANDLFAEFWVSKGEHLLIRKYDNNYWEVIGDYKGVHVGERYAAGYKSMPGTLPEDGGEVDGNEYSRLWWWILNVLPSTHYMVDEAGAYVQARTGQFIIKPGAKKIVMPQMQGISEKGMLDFNNYGADPKRPYDFPGGWQDQEVGPHKHPFDPGDQQGVSDNADDRTVMVPGTTAKETGWNDGTNNTVENSGVIYVRRI
ncbi:MAG: hypothetical protein ABIN94_21605 [Ferruginibacter sp.]